MSEIKKVNFVYLMTLLTALIGSNLIGALELQFNIDITGNFFANIIISQLLLITPTVIYIIKNKINIKEAIRFKKIRPGNVVLLVVFAYLISPIMSLINQISMLFAQNHIDAQVKNAMTDTPLWLGILLVALIPCILEESVYRGVFFNTYRKANTLKGIVLSGLLFGLMHLNFNQFMYAAVMGIIFAFLIEATDSILSSMIVHFVINGSSVIIAAMLPKMLDTLSSVYGKEFVKENIETAVSDISTTDILNSLPTEIVIAAVSGVLAFVVYRTIAKNTGRWEQIKGLFRKKSDEKETGIAEEKLQRREKLLSKSLIIAIVLCVLCMSWLEWGEIIVKTIRG